MKQKSFIVIILLCVLLTSCGTQEESPSKSIATSTSAVVATENDAIIEYATEEHPEDYYKEIELKYDEKIEYGEVYNSKGIVIKTTNFVNEEKDCYVECEIVNNSGQDLTFTEKSYSINHVNYFGDELISYRYNDGLSRISLKNGDSGKIKFRLRDQLSYTGYRIVSDMRFLIYASNKETKELVDKIYFEIETDKNDNIAHYIEYPKIYSDDYFSYDFCSYSHSRRDDTYSYQLSIYNKSDKWLKVNLTDVFINDILATDEDESFYNVVPVTQYGVETKADYYTTSKDIYVFPNCKQDITIVLNERFLDYNDIEKINNIKLNFKYYVNDMNQYSVQSTGVSFNPKDYK